MADEADSKSVVGNHVRVQVPLPAVLDKHRSPSKSKDFGVFVFHEFGYFQSSQVASLKIFSSIVQGDTDSLLK